MAREALDQLIAAMRSGGPDLSANPAQARADFEALLATLPVAEDIAIEEVRLAGRPALRITSPASTADRALLYLHGGGYVVGSARGYAALAGALGRASGTTVYSLDYRLAPENPFPAAVDDAVAALAELQARGFAADRIAVAGDSAGGGLALATMIAARDRGIALPAAAVLLSPWADLSCASDSMTSKAAADPALTPDSLRVCAARYLGGAAATEPLASPVSADLSGLPPLLIQVGSSEVLLDDAANVARAAGAAEVEVRLEIWPGMIHVWHAFAGLLQEGDEAIDAAGAFLKHRLDAS